MRAVTISTVQVVLLLAFGVSAAAQTSNRGRVPAERVARQFYGWYATAPHDRPPFTGAVPEPVRELLDPQLYRMLRQERADHPHAKPRFGYECALDADPFGLGNGGAVLSRAAVGTPKPWGQLTLVPVRLFLSMPRRTASSGPGYAVALLMTNEGGSAKIYDFGDRSPTGAYQFGLRSELTRMAHDPRCGWTR